MLILNCVLLLLFVYIIPALAVYPKLLLSSRTSAIIPIISMAIIFTFQFLLESMHYFTHQSVIATSVILGIIALYRLFTLFKNNNNLDWPKPHIFLFIFSLVIGLYFALIHSSRGFDADDEIYSWNMWAVQHYYSLPVDFYYTRSPYPQLFPRLIAYCYQLLGSIELQIPVKILFAIFPFCISACIALIPPKSSFANAIRASILTLITTALLSKNYNTALADPLMATALVSALFMYILFLQKPERYELFIFCIICSIVAILTKQAALIWALFSLPAMIAINIKKQKLPAKTIYGILLLIVIAILWMLGEGHHFTNNMGVISASKSDRNMIEQLWYGIRFQSKRPLVPLMIMIGTICIFSAKKHKDIFFFFLLPALFAWLEFGSYSDVRLGMHIIAIFSILIAASDFPIRKLFGQGDLPKVSTFVYKYKIPLMIVFLALISLSAMSQRNKNLKAYVGGFSVHAGGENTISKYFTQDSAFVYETLYDKSNILLWIPSNYIYGIFYAHTPIMRPDDHAVPSYTLKTLLDEIQQKKPDYLFDSGDFVGTPTSTLLRELANTQCPNLFTKVVSVAPPTKYNYTIYKLNKIDLLFTQCKANVL